MISDEIREIMEGASGACDGVRCESGASSSRGPSRLGECRLRAGGWCLSRDVTPSPQLLDAPGRSHLDPLTLTSPEWKQEADSEDDSPRMGDMRSCENQDLTPGARRDSSFGSKLNHQVWAKARRRAVQAVEAEEIGRRFAVQQQHTRQQQT